MPHSKSKSLLSTLLLLALFSFGLFQSGNVQASLNNGLVAYYPFDGNANDSSGNGNNGTENGGVVYVSGQLGQAASFDGTNDYVHINHAGSLNVTGDYTFSFWVNRNGDGKDDIIIRSTLTGQLYLYTMNGNVRTGSNIGGLSLGWDIAGIGDVGGDGKDDIIVRNSISGQLYLYEMNGNIRSPSNIGGLPPIWSVERIADYGGDGKADMLIRNTSSGQLYLYQMNGNARTGSNVGGLAPVWQVEVQ